MNDLRAEYQAFSGRGLKLDLTRGKPSADQIDLSQALFSLPGTRDYMSDGSVDCRNYGGPQGIVEARRLFAGILGAPPEQVVVGNNSSLAMMYDCVAFAMLKGTCDSVSPWIESGQVKFLCPTPGYDRHFSVCQELGVSMIPVRLGSDGPDMDEVERLAAGDESVKGMWCMPKYSNPTGAVYSDSVIERLAAMKTAAPDFRLWWDNAYCVHHLTSERVQIANILEMCALKGHPNRAFVFASTSKVTLPGAGLAMFASSKPNVEWLLKRTFSRTIGPDKINQLRHVRFLQDEEGILRLMDQHRALIEPKFRAVLDTFDARLAEVPGVSWSKPKGGYFITLQVPNGCAKRVVSLAKEAGIALTPAGAPYPYGIDPDDRTIRIAPTFPELGEVSLAAEGVAICVLLAVSES
jgi:DNA-binding transcriptional MocR family regulator